MSATVAGGDARDAAPAGHGPAAVERMRVDKAVLCAEQVALQLEMVRASREHLRRMVEGRDPWSADLRASWRTILPVGVAAVALVLVAVGATIGWLAALGMIHSGAEP